MQLCAPGSISSYGDLPTLPSSSHVVELLADASMQHNRSGSWEVSRAHESQNLDTFWRSCRGRGWGKDFVEEVEFL